MCYTQIMEPSRLNPFSFTKKWRPEDTAVEPEGIFLPAYRKLGASMTHRADIIWINTSMKKENIRDLIVAHPEFSWFPVCAGTVDSIVGVLSARKFLESLLSPEWCGLKALVTKPVYLPETVTLVKTLSALANAKSDLAFIIDEYGGIEGIITRNGIVRELIEEACDDFLDDDPDIFRREDGSYLVGGHIRMDELTEIFDFPDAKENGHEYYTLAGYLLSLNGSIPKTGDHIMASSYHFEIVDMDAHRIDKVLITHEEDANQSAETMKKQEPNQ